MTPLELEAIAIATAEAIKISVDGAVSGLIKDVHALQADILELKSDCEFVSHKSAELDLQIKSLDVRHFNPLEAQIQALQQVPPPDTEVIAKRAAELVPTPKDGKNADPVDLELLAIKAAALIPVPKDGTSVSLQEVEQKIADEVDRAVTALPQPQNGKDADPVDLELVASKAAALIPTPKDGVSVSLAEVEQTITDAVELAVSTLPKAKDGISVDPVEVERLITERVELAVAALPAPKDGTSVTTDDVAPLIASEVSKAVTLLPAAKDGRDGIDFNVKDLVSHDFDGERTLTLKFARDGITYDAPMVLSGLPLYRDVFVDDKTYSAGDMVTWGGSVWLAKADTTEKPGVATKSGDWLLVVKRGRDGKDGIGKPGQEGKPGRNGLDLTSMLADGTKYR